MSRRHHHRGNELVEGACLVRVVAHHTDDGNLQFFFDVHPRLEEIMQASELTSLSVVGKTVVQVVAAAFLRDLAAFGGAGYRIDQGVWAFGGFDHGA